MRLMRWPAMFGGFENSPAWLWFDAMTRLFSPYQTNPFDLNPLKEVLERCIDFDALREMDADALKLFVSATNVRSGKLRVFQAPEITVDVALASACLPHLFKAVEIDGEHYWDGGFMGNPPLFPLLAGTRSRDLLILHINPVVRPSLPITGAEIMNRINEISFNTPLMKELGTIAFIKKLKEHELLNLGVANHFKDVFLHAIRTDEDMREFSVATKFDTSWPFLRTLRDRGRGAMSTWLETNFDSLGKRDTIDLGATLPNWIAPLFDRVAMPPATGSPPPARANGRRRTSGRTGSVAS